MKFNIRSEASLY